MTYRFQWFQRPAAETLATSACLHAPWRATTRELRVAHHIARLVGVGPGHQIDPAGYPLATMSRGERRVLVRGTTCFLVERVR